MGRLLIDANVVCFFVNPMLTVMVCTLGGLFHHYTKNTKGKL